MTTYRIDLHGDTLTVGFGAEAQNDQIVSDATRRLAEMKHAGELTGGPLIKINGPASLPVAIAIGHAVSHLYGAVGVFDPKLNKYVIAVAHGGQLQPGDLID